MSRIRSVHPGFFRDDRLVPCSAFARLLFIGLGVEADDKGIFEWKPVTLKMSIFPGDNVDIAALLAELVEADAIRQYEAGGKRYGAIRNFRKYQKPKTPNDIHPMADGVAEYVHFPQTAETKSAEPSSFPQNGEITIQMEDGGGVEEEEQEPPLTPKGGEDELFDEAWRAFPHHPESVKSAARKQFDRLSDTDKRAFPIHAKHYRAFWVEECARRKQTQEVRLQYVPHLATWIKSDAWREALTLPVKAAASAAVTEALEYVDRITQEELFARCERLRGKKAPTSIQRFGFPREIVAAARAGEGAPA